MFIRIQSNKFDGDLFQRPAEITRKSFDKDSFVDNDTLNNVDRDDSIILA